MSAFSITLIRLAAGAACLTAAAAQPALAQLHEADLSRLLDYTQTGPSTLTPTGATFSPFLTKTNRTDFDAASLTLPDGTTQAFPSDPTFQSPYFLTNVGFASKSDMDSAYPAGSYTFTATNSGTGATQSTTVLERTDAYPSDTPALTAASYDALQNLNTQSGPLTLTWNAFDTDPTTDPDVGEFGSMDQSGFFVVNAAASCFNTNTTTTTCTIDPSTLTPDTTYQFEVRYDRVVLGFDPADISINHNSDYSQNTFGSFTTAPASASIGEPSVLIGTALLPLALLRRSRPGRIGQSIHLKTTSLV